MGTSSRNLLFASIAFGLVAGFANIANKAMSMFRSPPAAFPRGSSKRRRAGRAMTAASQRRAAKKLRNARARAPKRKV